MLPEPIRKALREQQWPPDPRDRFALRLKWLRTELQKYLNTTLKRTRKEPAVPILWMLEMDELVPLLPARERRVYDTITGGTYTRPATWVQRTMTWQVTSQLRARIEFYAGPRAERKFAKAYGRAIGRAANARRAKVKMRPLLLWVPSWYAEQQGLRPLSDKEYVRAALKKTTV